MAGIHRWWEGRSEELFWLEVTRREDIGANLKAPQVDEHGKEYWSYSLIKEIKEGNIVYHYDGARQAITSRSAAIGVVWEDEIMWAARGLSARSANIEPHVRPGWYLGLERFERLPAIITLEVIRERASALGSLVTSLAREVGKPLYFPFEIGDRRPIRPMQGYLFKLPSAFLSLFGIEARAISPAIVKAASDQTFGDGYRPADELAAIAERDPFAIDPALVERGIRSHAITQNALAQHLWSLGIEPLSPAANEINFDIAWRAGERVFVGEVKSLTDSNEEKQLRLGLGQVLRYAHQLDPNRGAVPVLIVERRPSDSSWEKLCERLGVVLAWPEVFAARLPTATARP
jgi:hypothetical protein